MPRDWLDWHAKYDQPGSSLARRLASVQTHIARALDSQPAGRIRVLSMCAGQGRDLLGVLRDHPRRDDVRALLVELDPRNIELGREAITELGLAGVRLDEADASTTSSYCDIVPVNVALVCGVFGNVLDEDIHATIDVLPSLLARDATVVWTRFPRERELLPRIDRWFVDGGFETVTIETGVDYGIGVHRFTGESRVFEAEVRMFSFVDDPDPRGRNVSPA